MTIHSGSCHCGQVRYEVEGEIAGGVACNCSMCQRKGSLLWFVPRTAMRVASGEDALATYTLQQARGAPPLCPTCRIHPFGEGVGPDGTAMAAINLRCIENRASRPSRSPTTAAPARRRVRR